MILNFTRPKGKMYCVYDIDTAPEVPAVTLEVYRTGEGRLERRSFTWDEVLGGRRSRRCHPPPPSPRAPKRPARRSPVCNMA